MNLIIKLNNFFRILRESFSCYPEFLKQSYPILLLGALLVLILRGNILFNLITMLAIVFLLGMLFLKANEIIKSKQSSWKDLSLRVFKRYFPSLGLAALLLFTSLCALFLPGYLYYILPNSILAMIINPIVLGVLGVAGLIIVGPYLFFSAGFFWFENKSILESLQASYELVKGQWSRIAISLFVITLCFAIPTSILLAIAMFVLSKTMFFGVILLAAAAIFVLPLWVMFPVSFYSQFVR